MVGYRALGNLKAIDMASKIASDPIPARHFNPQLYFQSVNAAQENEDPENQKN